MFFVCFLSDAPEFLVNHSGYISVSKGDDVSLSCEADGNPAPEYQWTVDDGVDVLENSSELTLTKVNNSASYTCTITNVLGNKTLSVLVHVPQVTPAAADPSPEAPAHQGTHSHLLYSYFLIILYIARSLSAG